MVKKKVRKKKKRSEALQKQNLMILILLIVAFGITMGVYYLSGVPEKIKEDTFSKVRFENGKIIEVEAVKSLREVEKGLMNRESLEKDHGMLFLFFQEEELDFWMLNMKFSLDIIFVNTDMIIVHIVNNAEPCDKEPCEVYNSGKPALYVVEVNSGYASENGIMIGQKVEFE